jgi:hypothetical protein
MDTEEEQRLRQLLQACDEVLDYHRRAGSSDGAAAKSIRSKRLAIWKRLTGSAASAR